ncbi:MAG: PaaI family thioesterase [Proteobacteria bacterium]|nr:PaaI family thioesterase [Pseudomonadota bacterium]MBU1389964.1 PaaI family thioesterase [Pseudomonadota bacterium]MBU1544177.1 PaaI family thioesterase [Pseudomonadota bacterium]MBU2431777.1 PaaI family thioesterase [Pseudomonadota bacterium]MBU2481155.1 PaaI family thioesterase [Pseudomonadota bacterium]
MDITELKALEGKYLASVESRIMNPVTAWLNPRLISIDHNRMECEFEVRPEMADPLGILHGSMRSAMLCDILGILANHPGDEVSAITTGMNIDFIGKAFVGEKVRVIARVINKGRSLIYMSGEILNEKKQIVAKGSTSLFVLEK